MADRKISELDDAAALDGTEEFAAVQSGTTVRVAASDITDLIGDVVVLDAEPPASPDQDLIFVSRDGLFFNNDGEEIS